MNKQPCKDCLWSSWDPHAEGIVLLCRRHDYEKLMAVRSYRKHVEKTCGTFKERPLEEEKGQWTPIKIAEAMDIQRKRGEPVSSLTCMKSRTAVPSDPVGRLHAAQERIERRKREQQSIERWLDASDPLEAADL